MSVQCLVLDFDGTLTDVQQEGKFFNTLYQQALARFLDAQAIEEFNQAQIDILTNPSAYGWKVDGEIVAPADADPYIVAGCAANQVFDKRQVLLDKEERVGVLQNIFKTCYAKVPVHFKTSTRKVLQQLLQSGVPVRIVSNSQTEIIAEKIATLKIDTSRLKIYGNARKYLLHPISDPAYASLPTHVMLENLNRKVLLHRGHYFDVLQTIFKETGAKAHQVAVCGDIFELDLALPMLLGCEIHLLQHSRTPMHEIEAVKNYRNGHVHRDIKELL